MSKRRGFEPTVVNFAFSRPLSWAEREFFYESVQIDDNILHHYFLEGGSRVVVISKDGREELWERIHAYVSQTFVNVFITAAKTISPVVKV